MDKEKEIEEMANIMYNADIIGKLLEFTKMKSARKRQKRCCVI